MDVPGAARVFTGHYAVHAVSRDSTLPRHLRGALCTSHATRVAVLYTEQPQIALA